MPASPSRYVLFHKRLVLFTQTLHGLEEGRVSALHRARVASRRLREVLPVLQLDRDLVNRLGKRLRRVTGRLGTVRDLDVLLLLVDELQESGRYDEAALARVAGAIAQDRNDARVQLFSKLPMPELRRLSKKLHKVADGLVDREKGPAAARGWQWALDARVGRRAGVLKSAIEDAGNVYLPDRVHVVRIALKKFRYAVELETETSADKSWAHHLASLKRMQGVLGRIHDRQMLVERVRRVQASLSPPNLGLWRALDSLLTAIETDCRRLHAKYVRDAAPLAEICERLAGRASPAPSHRRAG